MSETDDRLLTIQEVVGKVGSSRATIYDMVETGFSTPVPRWNASRPLETLGGGAMDTVPAHGLREQLEVRRCRRRAIPHSCPAQRLPSGKGHGPSTVRLTTTKPAILYLPSRSRRAAAMKAKDTCTRTRNRAAYPQSTPSSSGGRRLGLSAPAPHSQLKSHLSADTP